MYIHEFFFYPPCIYGRAYSFSMLLPVSWCLTLIFLLDRAAFAGDLQSLSWLSMALGGICGCLLGGHALDNLPIDTVFLLFAALPALQLVSCGLVQESPINTKASTEDLSLTSSHVENGDTNTEIRDTNTTGYYRRRTKRRKKNQKNSKKKAANFKKSHIQSKNDTFALQWFYSFKKTACSLFDAFRQPIIYRYVYVNFPLARSHFSGGVQKLVHFLLSTCLPDYTWSFLFLKSDVAMTNPLPVARFLLV